MRKEKKPSKTFKCHACGKTCGQRSRPVVYVLEKARRSRMAEPSCARCEKERRRALALVMAQAQAVS